MTKRIYNYLLTSGKKTFTSDQIAIAVTSSKLNLKCHVIDRVNCDHCIPKYYPTNVHKQQFFHYHKLSYLRSIFINFDLRVFKVNEKGLHRLNGHLIFDNKTFQKICRSMLKEWKYFLNDSNDKDTSLDVQYLINFLKKEINDVDDNYEGSDINLKIKSQLKYFLKYELDSLNNYKF